jgi:protein MAK11
VGWGSTDAGEEFCVGFERGVLVFGMDSKPKCKVVPEPRTKIHQLCYVQVNEEEDVQIMAISTEDGRILFYSTRPADLTTAKAVEGKEAPLPSAKLIAQLGGKDAGLSGRIKDFTILNIGEGSSKEFIIPAASSDGALRIWKISASDLTSGKVKQVGKLLGMTETGNRITCLKAFVMLPKIEGDGDEEVEIEDFEGFEDREEDEEESSSDSE